MESLSIIKDFDVSEQILLEILDRFISFMVRQFGLQRRPKALHGRIVIAVPHVAHAHRETRLGHQRLIRPTRMTRKRVPQPLGPYDGLSVLLAGSA